MSLRSPSLVRFQRQWRCYAPGAVTDKLGRGVAELLVHRKIASFETDASQPKPAGNRRRKS